MIDQSERIVEAINDLARVFLACGEKPVSKSETIRRLHLVAMKPSRIGILLSMPVKDVTSSINKFKKANGGRKGKRSG